MLKLKVGNILMMAALSGSSAPKTAISIFVDGEYLTFRFQELIKAGKKPASSIDKRTNTFVWSNLISGKISDVSNEILSAKYYASYSGKAVNPITIERKIKKFSLSNNIPGVSHFTPALFKRPARSTRTVELVVSLSLDIAQILAGEKRQAIVLFSGATDLLPLMDYVKRSSDQLYIAAFNGDLAEIQSKISPHLTIPLDSYFFK